MEHLINKYNVAGPRYTSYPTVPYWNNEGHNELTWKRAIKWFLEEWQSDQYLISLMKN